MEGICNYPERFFASIAIIGVVPRLTQKSHTEKYIKLYEEAIIWGGILGASCLAFDFYFPIGIIGTIMFFAGYRYILWYYSCFSR